jgi:thioredoxin:protein disulfide reductase
VSRRQLLLAGLAVLGMGGAWAGSRGQAAAIDWLHDEDRAFAESRRTGKPVLVEAWAEWCTACKLMDRNSWSDPAVQREVRERFVPLRLDFTEDSPTTDAWRRQYGVDGLPTLLACKAPGCAGAPKDRVTGLLKPAELLAFLAAEVTASR